MRIRKMKLWKDLHRNLNMNALQLVTIWEVWEEGIIQPMEEAMMDNGIVSMIQALIRQILKILLMLQIMYCFIRELKMSKIKLLSKNLINLLM